MKILASKRRVTGLAAALALGLAGCGGGIWIGYSDEDWDDGRAPSVSIAVGVSSVPAGGVLRVVAAAADANGIDDVEFYRRDPGGWNLVARDRSEPYEASIDVPADGRSAIEVFARATDFSGRQADSAVLLVPVLR